LSVELPANQGWVNNTYTIRTNKFTEESDVIFYYPEPDDFEDYVNDRIYICEQSIDRTTDP